ncbi:MAG: hypothetical protein WD035_05155 [Balneolaceae bacterium]
MNILQSSFSLLLAVSLFSILGIADLSAQDRPANSEIGIIIGEPTGLSAKFWSNDQSAFDVGLAWSFRGSGSIHLHADYLRHQVLVPETNDLLFYYGLGGRMLFRDDPKVGIRIPVGLQYLIPQSRLSVFFELVPMLNLIPATEFDANGGLGVRYFF